MRTRAESLKILGLPPSADAASIREAYRDLAQVWHPDRFAHAPELQLKAQEKMKELNEAYDTLKNSSQNDVWSAEPERKGARTSYTQEDPPPAAASARVPVTRPSSGFGMRLAAWALVMAVASAAVFYVARNLSRASLAATGHASILGSTRPDHTRSAGGPGRTVTRGASHDAVLAVLGPPESKNQLGSLEVWHYGRSTVLFTADAVTGWQNAGDFVVSQ